MVKLIYQGVMHTGTLSSLNGFNLNVKSGETYDLPADIAKECLKNGEWVLAQEPKKEVKVESKEENKK